MIRHALQEGTTDGVGGRGRGDAEGGGGRGRRGWGRTRNECPTGIHGIRCGHEPRTHMQVNSYRETDAASPPCFDVCSPSIRTEHQDTGLHVYRVLHKYNVNITYSMTSTHRQRAWPTRHKQWEEKNAAQPTLQAFSPFY